MNLIYLVGYMGSGKTTIGKELAKLKGWSFIDLDDLIVSRLGMSVPTIFERYGEDVFRELEASALHSTFSMSSVVIATGGGAPCFYENMVLMKEHGKVFYLNLAPEIILERVKNDQTVRPILNDRKDVEILRFIREHLNMRLKFYGQASSTIDANQEVAKVVQEIDSQIAST